MPEQSSEATVVSEESAPETTVQEQTQPEPATTSFAEALAIAVREGGHQFGGIEPPKQEEQSTTTEAEIPGTEPETGSPERPPATQPETEPPKGLSIVEQISWFKDHGKETPWYLPRIAEQSATLGKRTERLEKAEQRVQELEGMLSKQSGPQPTREQPFANVWDRDELKKLENTYEELLKVATLHPNGVEGVVVGKNKDGSDIVEDWDADKIAEIRYNSDRALRKDIPARRQDLDQRDRFLVERRKADAIALDKYPEFKDADNPMTQKAITIIKQNPNLEYVLGPEILTWVARALKGEELEAKRNGSSGAVGDAAQRIVQSAGTRIAPSVTKTRSVPDRKGADVASAKQNLEKRGDTESGEALVSSILSQRRGTAKRIEHVA